MSTGIFVRGTVLSARRDTESGRLELEVKGSGTGCYHVIAQYDSMTGAVPSPGERVEIAGTASYADKNTTIWADSVKRENPSPRKKRCPSVFSR